MPRLLETPQNINTSREFHLSSSIAHIKKRVNPKNLNLTNRSSNLTPSENPHPVQNNFKTKNSILKALSKTTKKNCIANNQVIKIDK
jgi:hypothetical protein